MASRSRSALLLACSFGILILAVSLQQAAGPGPRLGEEAAEPIPALADGTARYWKGNLHTHSLWSDGDDFPEMIADWYKRNQYQFLAMTDHNVLAEGSRWIPADKGPMREEAMRKYLARFGANWVETRTVDGNKQVRLKPLPEYRSTLEEPGRFLMIPGEEITHRYAKYPVHINAINLRDVILPIDGNSVGETLRVNLGIANDARERTGWKMIAFLNHPNFQWGVKAEDMLFADDLKYFEVFNGHPGVRNYGDDTHPSCEQLWDIVNSVRLGKLGLPPIYGLATDDSHRYHEWGVGKVNPGRGWIMVRATHLTAEAMVDGLEQGDFYSSSGVILDDVQFDGKSLAIKIRGEEGVKYQTEFVATMKGADLEGKVRKDDQGEQLDVSRLYSDEIGKVVARSSDLNPKYELTGQELFVRARILSDKPHPNPYAAGDNEVAWVQPVTPNP